MITGLTAVLSGGVVGFFLSLIGGGGSIIAVPLLLYAVGVPSAHVAIGTSAVAVTINASASLATHARAGHVRWLCAAVFAAVGTAGAVAGSTIGKTLDGDLLLFAFGLVMILVGVLMMRPRSQKTGVVPRTDFRTCAITGLAAVLAGLASGLFGIGGGFLIVPAMILATGLPTINAIGSSLLAVGAFGLATATNYALSGLVDWTLAAEFVAGGLVGGVAGMKIASRIAGRREGLNRIFAALVFAAAAYTIYRSAPALLT